MSYPQTLKYEVKVRTCIHSSNEADGSFVEDIHQTPVSDTFSLLRRSETEKLQYSI